MTAHVDTESSDLETSDGCGTTDVGEEPPTSEPDEPALSTISSAVSGDDEDNVDHVHRKRKRCLSPDQLGESASTQKSHRVWKSTNAQMPQTNAADSPQDNISEDSADDLDIESGRGSVTTSATGHYRLGMSRSAKAS